MGRKDFDDLLQVLEGAIVMTASTIVSLEMDFEIPRGYIIKIHQAILKVERLAEDFETISADKLARIAICLLLDPDDVSTTTMSSNAVDHDVLMDLDIDAMLVAGTAGDVVSTLQATNEKLIDFGKMDVVSARNMRLNARASGTDAGDITETFAVAQVYYTLERVTDIDVLNLLDIL